MYTLHFAFAATVALLSLPFVASTSLRSLDNASVQYFTISRRGGKFQATVFGFEHVNMTYLAQELERTENRFNLTQRQIKGNKLVRKKKDQGAGGRALTEQVASQGIW